MPGMEAILQIKMFNPFRRKARPAGMKLDTFIYETIADITKGISRAQTDLKDQIVINPIVPDALVKESTRVDGNIVRLTELHFDVELTSGHGIEVSAATVAPPVVKATGGTRRGGTSRVAFTLSVAFPAAVIDLPDTNPY